MIQKKQREKITKRNGKVNHPTDRSVAMNMISIGIVTTKSVTITNRRFGWRGMWYFTVGSVATASACSVVDSRETAIAPTAPGSP